MTKEDLNQIATSAKEDLAKRRAERLERLRVAREDAALRAAERRETAFSKASLQALSVVQQRAKSRARKGKFDLVYLVGRNTAFNRELADVIVYTFKDLNPHRYIKSIRCGNDYDGYYTAKYVKVKLSW